MVFSGSLPKIEVLHIRVSCKLTAPRMRSPGAADEFSCKESLSSVGSDGNFHRDEPQIGVCLEYLRYVRTLVCTCHSEETKSGWRSGRQSRSIFLRVNVGSTPGFFWTALGETGKPVREGLLPRLSCSTPVLLASFVFHFVPFVI